MKIPELEFGGGGRISRSTPKLAVDDLQRSSQTNWDVEFGRLMDRARGKSVTAAAMIQRIPVMKASVAASGLVQPYPYEPSEVEDIFEALAERWENETEFLSMTPQITGHPAYFDIVALGFPAVPLILERLKRDVRPWFQALAAMTRENPAVDAESNSAAAEAWIGWGRQRGLVD